MGGGLSKWATKKKRNFFYVRKKVSMATKPRGRATGLCGRATRKELFTASLRDLWSSFEMIRLGRGSRKKGGLPVRNFFFKFVAVEK